MARPNRAKVEDEGLSRSFAQGLNEGLRLTGYVTLFFEVGSKRITRTPMVAVADVPATVSEFLSTLRAEHYEVGVTIKIMAEGDIETQEAEQPVISDGIEDAEVVEE